MKRVSFKVAKAIKEAGYPQGNENTAYYNENGMLVKPNVFNGGKEIADAPFVMEVWLWLWREKTLWLSVRHIGNGNWFKCWMTEQDYSDPEEAIIAAIEYMVENNLIK